MSEETRNEGDSADRKRLLGYVQLGVIGVAVLVAIYLARAPRPSLPSASSNRRRRINRL